MKITKKAIKEAPAFIIGIDYKASYKPMTIELKSLTADNLLDVMKEANNYWDDETVWCLLIYRKTDIVEDDAIKYEECLGAWRENRWQTKEIDHLTPYVNYSLICKEPMW